MRSTATCALAGRSAISVMARTLASWSPLHDTPRASSGSRQVDPELHQAQGPVEAPAVAIWGEHGRRVELVSLLHSILEVDATKQGSLRAENLDRPGHVLVDMDVARGVDAGLAALSDELGAGPMADD